MERGNAFTVHVFSLFSCPQFSCPKKEPLVPIEVKADIHRPSPEEFKTLERFMRIVLPVKQ